MATANSNLVSDLASIRRHRLVGRNPYPSYEDYLSEAGKLPEKNLSGRRRGKFIETLQESGLRGRGGAGFPTGRKWQTLYEHPCKTRYVVCNAAEGEPGTFKDRWLLHHNPFAVLEGMWIAHQVLGAAGAYLAIKSSFAPEIARLKAAHREMQAEGLFPGASLEIVTGPEEYLFGEEKALLNVIENEGPFPRTPEEPPYEVGLFATPLSPNPALVNNVQTFAHVASIARHGAASFRESGTASTPGMLLITLCGDVMHPGMYELPAGISLNDLLNSYGGGALPGRKFKAVLPGVSAAAILPANFDTPLDFDAMKNIGSGLGAAGFIVLDDSREIPAVTETIARFLYVESCNQCFACKAGLRRAFQALEKLRDEKADARAIVEIHEAAESAPQGNRCYLPVQGANLIPSLLKNFQSEFTEAVTTQQWLLPKIVDYDELTHRFEYDKMQRFKQPDWTFTVPENAASKPSLAGSPSTGD
jgi:NADH:ubiquinone oxidoreductase, NADH-binding (51 kD) subunit